MEKEKYSFCGGVPSQSSLDMSACGLQSLIHQRAKLGRFLVCFFSLKGGGVMKIMALHTRTYVLTLHP